MQVESRIYNLTEQDDKLVSSPFYGSILIDLLEYESCTPLHIIEFVRDVFYSGVSALKIEESGILLRFQEN